MASCAAISAASSIIVGLLCLIVGGAVYGVFPGIYQAKVEENLVIDKDVAEILERFEKPPVPSYIEFYLFNVTNFDDVNKKQTKPMLQEVGPYVYRQEKIKENITFNEDEGTVSYQERSIFTFDVDKSKGSDLNAVIHHVDAPNIGIASMAAGLKDKLDENTFQILKMVFPNKLVVRHKASQMLFDGYEMAFLKTIIMFIPSAMHAQLPKNLMWGAFYDKNNTLGKVMTVYTGKKDMQKFTNIEEIDGENKLQFWTNNTHCNDIVGTDGTQFPPAVKKESKLNVYSHDVCRSLRFIYDKDVVVEKIDALRFKLDPTCFESPRKSQENACYCVKGINDPSCPLAGVIPVATCQGDKPIAMSAPHFYLGDKSYSDAFDGISPVENIHGTFLDIEPVTGTVLRGRKRLQANIIVTPNLDFKLLAKAKEAIFPLFRIQEGGDIDAKTAEEFRDKVVKPFQVTKWSLVAVMAVGAVVILLVIMIYLIKK